MLRRGVRPTESPSRRSHRRSSRASAPVDVVGRGDPFLQHVDASSPIIEVRCAGDEAGDSRMSIYAPSIAATCCIAATVSSLVSRRHDDLDQLDRETAAEKRLIPADARRDGRDGAISVMLSARWFEAIDRLGRAAGLLHEERELEVHLLRRGLDHDRGVVARPRRPRSWSSGGRQSRRPRPGQPASSTPLATMAAMATRGPGQLGRRDVVEPDGIAGGRSGACAMPAVAHSCGPEDGERTKSWSSVSCPFAAVDRQRPVNRGGRFSDSRPDLRQHRRSSTARCCSSRSSAKPSAKLDSAPTRRRA